MPSSGKLAAATIRPGINKNVSDIQGEGLWVDSDKVRFHNGNPEKFGGWQKFSQTNNYRGVARDIQPWSAIDGSTYVAVGTDKALGIYYGGSWYDITPVKTSVSASTTWFTSTGSYIVRMIVSAHGATKGDAIYNPVSAPVSTYPFGVAIYEITSVLDDNTFDVETDTTATFDARNDLSHPLWFLLSSGNLDNSLLSGWGSGTYGSGTWGIGVPTSTTDVVNRNLRLWSLETWGEDLIASPRNGAIYYWTKQLGTSQRAALVTTAPRRNLFTIVSEPVRHLICCGTSTLDNRWDSLAVRWSSNDDYTQFNPAVTNASGEQRIRGGSTLVGGIQSKRQILLFTDEGAHEMRFDESLVFTFDKLGSNCGLVAQNAVVDINGTVYWMGLNGFYRYDGAVEKMDCPLSKILFESGSSLAYSFVQRDKIYAGTNMEFNEIIWMYPIGDNGENSRYVIYNYAEDVWYDGSIVRTTWKDANVLENPIATNTSAAYYHEVDNHDDDGNTMRSYLQSGWFNIEDGQKIQFIDKYIPDFRELSGSNMKFTIDARRYPGGPIITKGPYSITSTTEQINLRIKGREMRLKYDVSAVGSNFELGTQRFNIRPDGER